MTENELASKAVDIIYNIHKEYGPGLFESVYEEIFCFEWMKTGLPFQRQWPIPVVHHHIKMEAGFRADVILDRKVIIEIKSVESLGLIHTKQVATYLKLAEMKLGILVNFNVPLIKDGIRRVVNKL